ncbi:MAG: arylsulfatase [Pirellulaceae bacterium]
MLQNYLKSTHQQDAMSCRREFPRPSQLCVTVIAFVVSLAFSTRALDAKPLNADPANPPNIILIMTDDQGYGPIGRHGHPWIKTPHLDDLYDQSTRFTRMLVSPTCSPTRSALMTGRHPMRNGITHTILERERMTLDATTLPQVLGKQGYRSGIFGKWHLGDEDPYQPQSRGFDEAFIHGAGGIGQAYNCSCADAPGNKYFNPVLRHNGEFVQTEGYCTDLFFAAALGWIRQQKEKNQPFFAYIATNAPHGPFIAPPENEKRFTDLGFTKEQAGFYGMIENIDENVGKLLDKLDQWQLGQNTFLIFMSDNGMTGGGSGRLGKPMGTLPDGTKMFPYNADMKGLKGSVDEGGVRVPFFVRWPGHVEAGRDVDRIAAHIDVFPTLVDLVGGNLPEGQVEGRSLLPLIEDPQADWQDRYLFSHRGRWGTGEDPDAWQWKLFSVRNQRFRWVGPDALFDMQSDPSQTTNVIDKHPEVVSEMRQAYDAWWKSSRPLMVNEDAPMSPTRPFHVAFERQKAKSGIPKWNSPAL